MGDLIDRLIWRLWLHRIWGPRCSEYQEGCPTCEEWAKYDWFVGDAEEGE